MSDSSSSPNGPEERPLHLGKFALGEASEAPSNEGPTMMIRRIAGKIVEKELGPTAEMDAEFGMPVKEMLGVITHCYVRGIFCSKDIANLLRDEHDLRAAFGRSLPDEAAIRRFRRRHAELIEGALEDLYRAYPAGGPDPAAPETSERTTILHKEAVERLHEAAWTDNTKGRLG